MPPSSSSSSLGFRVSAAVSSSSSSAASGGVSRHLPPLFGGVVPSRKPGAALAAAAAASRSLPTPHAAAIKNRKAGSGALSQKVEVALDLGEAGEISEAVSSLLMSGDGEREILASISPNSSSSFGNEAAAISEEGQIVEDSSFVNEIERSQSVEAKEEILVDNLVESSSVIDEDVNHVDGALAFQDEVVLQDEVVPNANNGDGIDNHDLEVADGIDNQELAVANDERDYDSDEKAADKGGEISGGIGEVGDMGDEIDKLVEERLEEMESCEKAAKRIRASMKPLEWAEELEKRHASYGLHWEEGAAAQPMRLEGIQRGPPAVGYLQIDLDNAVTRTISSHMFKRDCGSPLVVAVHINFIAMGTSKGVVLVFPSKYSVHSPDHMDSKVSSFNI